MLTYDRAKQIMKTARRTSRWPNDPVRKLANNTYLLRRIVPQDRFEVWLHGTPIITLYPTSHMLIGQRWRTPTTRDRINTFSPATVINWRGWREWAVVDAVGYWRFEDRIRVDEEGQVLNGNLLMSKKERANRRRAVRAAIERAESEVNENEFWELVEDLIRITHNEKSIWWAEGVSYRYAFTPDTHVAPGWRAWSDEAVNVYIMRHKEILESFQLSIERFDLVSPLARAARWRWLEDLAKNSRELRVRRRLDQLAEV